MEREEFGAGMSPPMYGALVGCYMGPSNSQQSHPSDTVHDHHLAVGTEPPLMV